MAKCIFCNKEIRKGYGLMYVKKDGKVMWFCSSKCRKNFFLGRNPKKLKWTR